MVPLPRLDKLYDTRDVPGLVGSKDRNQLILGPGAGSHDYLKTNSEFVANVLVSSAGEALVQKSKGAQTLGDGGTALKTFSKDQTCFNFMGKRNIPFPRDGARIVLPGSKLADQLFSCQAKLILRCQQTLVNIQMVLLDLDATYHYTGYFTLF